MLYQKQGWKKLLDLEYEFNRYEMVCEGIDNTENIDRHYEKTMLQQLKTKKTQMQTMQKANQNQQIMNQINVQGQENNKMTSKIFNQRIQQNFEQSQSRVQQIDSTILYFSTTYDNTTSSIMANFQDDSLDSIEQLNLNERTISLDQILMPECLICFKILDLYSVQSEKTHEFLSVQSQKLLRQSEYLNSDGDLGPFDDKGSLLGNLRTERKLDEQIFLRGIPILNLNQQSIGQICKCSNSFLCKIQKKMNWILNNIDMTQHIFYELLTEQLATLSQFLALSTSRTICYEFLDSLLDILFMVKRIFVEITLVSASSAPTPGTKTNRSNNIISHFLKPILKPTIGQNFIQKNQQTLFSKNSQHIDNLGHSKTPFIIKEKQMFGYYLDIISQLLIKSKKLDVINLILKLFVNNDLWVELTKIYAS